MIHIKWNKVFSVIILILFISGCQHTNTMVDVITFKPSNYQVMFFPNNTEKDTKNVYMDAMLELKAKYPKAFTEVEAIEKEVDELKDVIKQDEPILIISKNGRTISQLSGEKPKTEIVEQLEMTMK
ncbi:hypothetical protein CIL05_08270 [Virgibacillus profundi]|uniref:Small peptidoglycan-associated lipoprotein n=1 Tax=Virgibacillus profundi TaxID=2024555 RepID=A0A2A2IFF7_9BACI|nr:hypothetical protein [Virgibacillus profundi]PAV29865.1 hypothetical protein CIL05_08270 [Virgibacillus profundi]PXY54037.1 hypothetical protein CIT14_08355 [Virgibacillus profundi]